MISGPAISGIYAIRHISGTVYVGSAKNIKKRMHIHKFQLESGRHHSQKLQRAWNKYGADQFVAIVLEAVNEDMLVEREQHHIDAFMAYQEGFNCNPMAGSSAGRRFSEETKNAMSKKRKGVPVSEETKKKMSAAHKGRPHSESHRLALAEANRRRALIPISQETRERMSESAKARNARARDDKGKYTKAEQGVKWSEPALQAYEQYRQPQQREQQGEQ